jgi:hypothetical protein
MINKWRGMEVVVADLDALSRYWCDETEEYCDKRGS